MCYFGKMIGIIVVGFLLFGCVAPEEGETGRPCQLCEYRGFQGDGRLGVLLVDTGRMMEIEVPAYEMIDDLEINGKYGFSMMTGKAAQGMNRVTMIVRPHEGTARVSAEIRKKASPDKQALSELYCRDCVSIVKKSRTGILLTDLQENTVYPIGDEVAETFEIREYKVVSQHYDGRAVLEISL